MLNRLYVTPIVTADTPGYLSAADGGWGRYYRSPAYGYLLQLGVAVGSLKAVVWAQIAVWCLMLAVIAFVAGQLLLSPVLGGLVALACIGYEIQEMLFLPYHWHLLTESLSTNGMIIAILGGMLAVLRRSTRLLFCSVLVLGLVIWMKPVPVLLLIGMGFLFTVLRPRLHDHRSLFLTLGACVLLLGPVLSVSVYNASHFGSMSPSPIGGLTVMSHTSALYKGGDRVFDNDVLNQQFANVMRTGTYDHPDLIGFPMENTHWGAMRSFFDFISGETETGRRVFAVDRISKQVFWRLVLEHPTTYVRHVFQKARSILILGSEDDLPWRNGKDGIVRRQVFLLGQMPLALGGQLHGLGDPAFERMDFHVVAWVNHARFLSEDALMSFPWQMIQLALLCFALMMAILLLRLPLREARLTGALILLLLGTAMLITVFTAALVFIDDNDSRYRLPAAACCMLAVFLSLASLPRALHDARFHSVVS